MCNRLLLILATITLFSSIQLEITHCRDVTFVWVHIVVAMLFILGILYHIQLHFGWSGWFSKFGRQKKVVTRILWYLLLLTILSAIVAITHWLPSGIHSTAGGIHGKIGLLMLALAIAHTVKRASFFKRK